MPLDDNLRSAWLSDQTNGRMGYVVMSVRWSNPYTSPPEGFARVRWGLCAPWPTPNRVELDALASEKARAAGPGYSFFLNFCDLRWIKRWTPERMAANRVRLMEQRIRKKEPLFAVYLIQKQLEAKPDYYDSEKIKQEIESRVRAEKEMFRALIENWVADCFCDL